MDCREKVLKGLSQHCDDSMFDRCGECPYHKLANKPFECRDELLEDVFALLKEQKPGWISVMDRLPDRQNPVLVYVPPYTDEQDEYVGYVGMAYYTSFGEGFCAGTDGNVYGAIGIIHEPTHWMPLPDQPREGQ